MVFTTDKNADGKSLTGNPQDMTHCLQCSFLIMLLSIFDTDEIPPTLAPAKRTGLILKCERNLGLFSINAFRVCFFIVVS